MRTSPSTNRAADPKSSARSYFALGALALAVLAGIITASLPASLIGHFLPPQITGQEYSGSLWHGSAGRVSIEGREVGAFEWRLHPGALFALRLEVDFTSVNGGFVVNGLAQASKGGIRLSGVRGGGPLEDVGGLGLANGWRGSVNLRVEDLQSDYRALTAITGSVRLSNLAAPQIAAGADLGVYDLTLPAGAVDSEGTVSAQLADAGGPIEVQARIRYAPAQRTGLLTGTVRARSSAGPALRAQLKQLEQLKPADAEGRIPVELEFHL